MVVSAGAGSKWTVCVEGPVPPSPEEEQLRRLPAASSQQATTTNSPGGILPGGETATSIRLRKRKYDGDL
jgi:hypothetical protein